MPDNFGTFCIHFGKHTTNNSTLKTKIRKGLKLINFNRVYQTNCRDYIDLCISWTILLKLGILFLISVNWEQFNYLGTGIFLPVVCELWLGLFIAVNWEQDPPPLTHPRPCDRVNFDLWRSMFVWWIDYDPIGVLYTFQIYTYTNSR